MRAPICLAAVAVACLIAAAPAGAQDTLRAGVGRADITPPQTGYYLGGWTRADRVALGQHTRLFAKAMVLERGGRKVALVAVELFMIPSGLHLHAAQEAGFDPSSVLMAATHTHSGPGGFANFPTLNTAAPSVETVTDLNSFIELLNPRPADVQLYTFLVQQIAKAIRAADADLGPAAAGWGKGHLSGITHNRSLEAHLADHGIIKEPGEGKIADDPGGYEHTIDPSVDVLRVDKLVRRKRAGKRRRVRMPIGAWSNFADHGTVTKAEFGVYDGDHHASAHRVFEKRVRKAGKVPGRQLVLNVYGNSNEGDMSAGLDHTGPAGADEVGRAEAAEMFRAWRRAGRRLSRRPSFDFRWTRVCFCGEAVAGGNVAPQGVAGMPFFTGSEENRGPLFDITRISFEGRRNPLDHATQGHKFQIPAGTFPGSVPLMVVRVADGLIASLPAEPSKEIGARVKDALLGVAGPGGIRQVVISGLTNEYINYITTPEEYDRQHYEGGSSLFGPLEGVFLQERLADLTGRLMRGEAPPAPAEFDPTNGVRPDGPPYSTGADSATLLQQPGPRVARLGHAQIAWQGGVEGHDRPVDTAFITAQWFTGSRWRTVASDLGLGMVWRVNSAGRHDAYWEVPLGARPGLYRLIVTANRYRLVSNQFQVAPTGSLTAVEVPAGPDRVALRLDYPQPIENLDLTFRPVSADGGLVRFKVGGRTRKARVRRGAVFSVKAPAGAGVEIPAGAARDRYGNFNGGPLRLR